MAMLVSAISSGVSVSIETMQDFTSTSLKDALSQVRLSNQSLLKEVDMFENFLTRMDPKDKYVPSLIRMSRRSGDSSGERMKGLTIVQKCDIATRELEELKEQIQRNKDEAEKNNDNHKAVVTESDMRLAEAKKGVYEFDRDIVRGAINSRTGLILGERVFKYLEDRLKSQETLMEKLWLKNCSLRIRRGKLQAQLKQKEEAGEVRHEVDFEQLKIENKQYNEKFEEKNQELLKLKLSAGNTLQVLNTYKKKLHFICSESERIDSEINQRNELLMKIEIETNQAMEERDKAEGINMKTKKRLDDFKVPNVINYVGERASLYELSKTVRAWERKVEISEMALRTYKQTYRQLYQDRSTFD